MDCDDFKDEMLWVDNFNSPSKSANGIDCGVSFLNVESMDLLGCSGSSTSTLEYNEWTLPNSSLCKIFSSFSVSGSGLLAWLTFWCPNEYSMVFNESLIG